LEDQRRIVVRGLGSAYGQQSLKFFAAELIPRHAEFSGEARGRVRVVVVFATQGRRTLPIPGIDL
jgi:hypothetical protein